MRAARLDKVLETARALGDSGRHCSRVAQDAEIDEGNVGRQRWPRWAEPQGLVLAAIAACLGACVGREVVIGPIDGGVLPASLIIVAGAAIALRWHRSANPPTKGAWQRTKALFGARLCSARVAPWLLAIPAALGSIEVRGPDVELPRPGPLQIDARVVEVRRDLVARSMQLTLEDTRLEGARVRCALAGGVRTILPGDRVRGLAVSKPASGNRGTSKTQSPARLPWIETQADALIVEPPAGVLSKMAWSRVTTALRFALETALLGHVPGAEGHLLCHLVLGHGPRIDDELVHAHRVTGLAHLLAVSGAHASMLAWMIALIYRGVRGRDPFGARRFRGFCAGFLLVYGGITGFDPPMFRALTAFAVVLLAHAHSRRLKIASLLAGPAVLCALLQPGSVFSASFCLSYAAVAGLGIAGALDESQSGRSALRHKVAGAVRASFWAVVTTAPFTLYYFGQLAPWTILATPILAPIVGVMLATGLITAIAESLDVTSLAAGSARIAESCTAIYTTIVRACTELPFAPVSARHQPSAATLIGYATAAIVVAPRFGRWRPRLLIAALLLCAPYFVGSRPVATETDRLQLLAVGHGQAALLCAEDGSRVLVDCGSLGDSRFAARCVEAALAPSRVLDVLIVSHGDFDHYGAVAELARRVIVRSAFLPPTLRGTQTAAHLLRSGTTITWNLPGTHQDVAPGVHIRTPDSRDGDHKALSENDRSTWVEASLRGVHCVLPGDAGAVAVTAWIEELQQPHPARCEILVLPHHGRGDPVSFGKLLDVLKPRLCLVSEGRAANAHADRALVGVARSRSIPVYSTADRGTISVDGTAAPRLHTEHPRRVLSAESPDQTTAGAGDRR